MSNAKRDDNYIPTLLAVSNADGSTPVSLYADPTTHRLLVSASVTPTPAGSDTQVQFNDAGALGADSDFTFNKTTGVVTATGIVVGTAKLVLGSGGVIDFNSDVTITHATDKITLAGGSLVLPDGSENLPALIFGSGTANGLHLQAVGVVDMNVASQFRVDIGGSANIYDFNTTALLPEPTNTMALGSAANQWADLFLGSGGVINFNNDVTLTHSASTLTVANGTLSVGTFTAVGTVTLPTALSGALIATAGVVSSNSNLTRRLVQLKVYADDTASTTGSTKMVFFIPIELNGMNLVDIEGYVSSTSTGIQTVQVRNVTDGVSMLSTDITIDADEFSSLTAATPPVINGSTDDVATGDRIAIDIATAGTAKGLGVHLAFQTP